MTGIERHWQEIADAERAEKWARILELKAQIAQLEFELSCNSYALQHQAYQQTYQNAAQQQLYHEWKLMGGLGNTIGKIMH